MPRTPTAPTPRAILTDLLRSAGQQVAASSTHLAETPLAWEGARNAVDLIRGLEIAQAVLREQELLDDGSLPSLRRALGHLRSARIALLMLGTDARTPAAVYEAIKAIGKAIEVQIPVAA